MKAIAVLGVGAAALLAVAANFFANEWSLTGAIVNQDDISKCSAGKFEVESRSARTEGGRIVVTAAVRNNNSVACGVQVSVAMKDKAGKQIAIEQLSGCGRRQHPRRRGA